MSDTARLAQYSSCGRVDAATACITVHEPNSAHPPRALIPAAFPAAGPAAASPSPAAAAPHSQPEPAACGSAPADPTPPGTAGQPPGRRVRSGRGFPSRAQAPGEGVAVRVLVGRREIPGFPGYLVTEDGNVLSDWARTRRTGEYRPLAFSTDAKGYAGLTLCAGPNVRRKARVHRLVAEVFHPNPLGLPCVRHLDGNPSNNAARNLAWGTHAENEADKVRHGTRVYAPRAKLSPEDRTQARNLKASGASDAAIAAAIGVSRPSISRLLSGKTWSSQ